MLEAVAGTDIGYDLPTSEVPLHVFKGFYVNPLVFVLFGTAYEIAPIVHEMLRIHRLLEDCANNGCMLPRSKSGAPERGDN